MLILKRRVGETVMVGDEVTITVVGIRGSLVRWGFKAPKRVAVHRKEIYDRIKREDADVASEETKGSTESTALVRNK